MFQKAKEASFDRRDETDWHRLVIELIHLILAVVFGIKKRSTNTEIYADFGFQRSPRSRGLVAEPDALYY